ncbi:MAG: AraC family transcriptional regulator [Gemmatimonadaceae bacterium]
MGTVLTHRPGFALQQCVESLWYSSGQIATHNRERVLPSGRFQIVIDLAAGRAGVSGMRSKYTEINAAALSSVLGIVFRPGGARRFFDAPPSDFHNQFVPLDGAWGRRASALIERLHDAATAQDKFRVLENTLTRMAQRGEERCLTLHPCVQHALAALHRGPHIRRVAEVARETLLSRRRFGQLFREQVGMTPKLYCRLRRFRGVVREIASGGEVDWTSVAFAGGYCDQSHMSHEFRDFSGLTPGDYAAAERPFRNHVRVD